jgi:DNA replication and repair protein RecF
VRVVAVRGTQFRCYERLELELPAGLVGVVGPNGAGKTALIEMIHFGCLGYSPRTSSEARVVRFGADFTRVETDIALRGGLTSVELGYRPSEPKRVAVDGAAERSIERLLGRFPVLVFTPDRLRLVQGAPALRRAYVDRALARLWPSVAAASSEYARRLAQRNHLLRRVRSGAAQPDALDPWDQLLGEAGAELSAARARLCSRLARPFAERLGELGGRPGTQPLRYQPNVEQPEQLGALLAARRGKDVERAVTGAGPHLDDIGLFEGDRDLRLFGSQGEQRRALLALILAEADVLTEERDEPPLLLLDDVTGELDAERRRLLLAAVSAFDQAIVTTTDQADLSGHTASIVMVENARVTSA